MEINIKELKTISKNPIYMAYLVSIAGLLFLGYLLIWKVDVEGMQKLKKEKERIIVNIVKVKEISKYRSSLKNFNKHSIVAKGANWLVEKISEVAKQNKVVLSYVEPLDSFVESDYSVQKVLVEGNGYYFSVDQFLLSIENDEKYTFIEELQLTARATKHKAEKSGEHGVLSKEEKKISGRQGNIKMIVINLSKR